MNKNAVMLRQNWKAREIWETTKKLKGALTAQSVSSQSAAAKRVKSTLYHGSD
jgi:hypothetical protein